MMLFGRELILGALLAALGLLAWWYSEALTPKPPLEPAAGRKPDYTAEEVTGVTMDLNGLPARRLETPRLRHYPDDGSTEFDTPSLWIFDAPAPPWRVRAERGWASAEGDELLLQGLVRAERDATDDLQPIVVTTSDMLLLPDAEYAETDRHVELERGQDRLSANDGMQLWFGEPMRIRLFGRTHARIEPKDTRP